jgi:predicted amidohydrolase YtcJ
MELALFLLLAQSADLVILNGKVVTLDDARPRAEAVAIAGERILKVGSNAEVRALAQKNRTRVLDVKGRLVLPGFIDNHTHFAQAGRLLLGLNLLEVHEPKAFRQRVREAAARLPRNAWLTGGDWGAYAKTAEERAFQPTRELLDNETGGRPALISRFDRAYYLANTRALEAAGITAATPNPPDGEILRGQDGRPNGLLRGAAVRLVQKAIPRPSREQRLAEARRALAEARRWGVTTIHDNTDFETLELFGDLQKSGELTARVWARMWLSDWEKVRDYIAQRKLSASQGGWDDGLLRLGGLKAWVDGIMGNSTALFFQPYNHQPNQRGRLRDVMFPEGNLYRLMKGADAAGFTITVHAIGDEANRILLDTYERVFAENPSRQRRHRVVHAQVLEPADLPRFGKLGLVAEVQPFHCTDDMRWMEERIGAARSRYAYAFRSLLDSGAMMSFGSDWPGTNASYYPINPLLGIYAAVTRQNLKGEPAAGWFPEERLTIEQAVRFFTLNNAWATFEEGRKGSIQEGKLADLVVLDRDIFTRPPRELLQTQVVQVVFNGRLL